MTLAGHFLDTLDRRRVAVALARWAAVDDQGRPRGLGDPVHEAVTEGRRMQYEKALAAGQEWAKKLPGYFSCGDLAHWLLARLGVRDERLVNRSDDGGVIPWRAAENLFRIQRHPAFVAAGGGKVPQPGDILHLLQHGGHVDVLLEWDLVRYVAVVAAYGQPYGAQRTRSILPTKSGGWLLDGAPLTGWLDLDALEYAAPVEVPDGCPL